MTRASNLKPPVFVMGSARSGTNFLYDALLSAGGFAVYRTEPVVFDVLLPKFGDFSKRQNRSRLLSVWFKSYQYRLSGLDRSLIEEKILEHCHNAGDFLTIVMNEIALRQGVERWAVWGPDNLLYIPVIARTVPGALFLHIIRDGRDVALSMNKKGFIRPFPWDKQRSLLAAALHWKWKVERGRQAGRQIPQRYLEIHFEDLVCKTRETLAEIGRFIGHDLDFERIQKQPIGTVRRPNSTFKGDDGKLTSDPVGRWKTHLSKKEIAQLESLIGPVLTELGYELEFPSAESAEEMGIRVKLMKSLYPAFFELKEWLKMKTPFGRFVNVSRLQFDAMPK
jgi:sulfotransferase family protein